MEFKNKIILITGGTGSFGYFITSRLLSMGVPEIRILSRDEKKQYDMKIFYDHDPRLNFFVGDIRDQERVEQTVDGVHIIYQVAALKQVPSLEYAPMEGVKTNILGVNNIINAALKYKVEKFITVSTDKAVKPVSVMGMTKALQERMVISANNSPTNKGTKLCVVRCGNVMQSIGSVIPFFTRQLSLKQPFSITDIEMTRFLLTHEDAIDLMIFATKHTVGGEIFVKKTPSVKIIDIARYMAHKSKVEFKYQVIGKYGGEKIHEILISEEELQRTEDKDNYFIVYPWWSKKSLKDVLNEYSSNSELIKGKKQIKDLFLKSEQEFKKLGFE